MAQKSMELPNDFCKATGWVTERYWIVHINRKQLYNYYVLFCQYKYQKYSRKLFTRKEFLGYYTTFWLRYTISGGIVLNKQVWLIVNIKILLNPLYDGLKPFQLYSNNTCPP